MKRGFTLIELLAVIAVLAIISLIAVPIVINIINDAKIESLKKSMHFYIDAVEKNISSRQIIDPDYEPDECIIQENGNVICSQNSEVLKISETSNELEIAMKGKKPSSGTIRLQDGKVIDIIDIYLDGKTANYDEKKNIVFSTLQIPTEPWLYDADEKLIANWEETKEALGLDLDSDGYLPCSTDEEWAEDCVRDDSVLSNAKILVISDEVTSIGGHTFDGCTELISVTFENTTGWFTAGSSSATSGTNMTVTNPSTNATNLKSTYKDYYWKRN